MARKKVKEKPQESAEIDFEYWTEITYICPKRGKVTEKVKATRYKPQKYKPGALDVKDLDFIRDDQDVEE
jgi:hypothetical protein